MYLNTVQNGLFYSNQFIATYDMTAENYVKFRIVRGELNKKFLLLNRNVFWECEIQSFKFAST